MLNAFVYLEQAYEEEQTMLKALTTQSDAETAYEKRNTPLPPIFISRSSTSITLKVPNFWTSMPTDEDSNSSVAALRKKKTINRVNNIKIFGKPKGAGTAVSLNNIEYGGLGDR